MCPNAIGHFYFSSILKTGSAILNRIKNIQQ